MFSIEELENVLKFKALVGADSGACFGTRDASRLRPAFTSTRKRSKNESLQGEEKKANPAVLPAKQND